VFFFFFSFFWLLFTFSPRFRPFRHENTRFNHQKNAHFRRYFSSYICAVIPAACVEDEADEVIALAPASAFSNEDSEGESSDEAVEKGEKRAPEDAGKPKHLRKKAQREAREREERARREIEVRGWGIFKIYLKSRSFCRSFRRIWRCIGRVLKCFCFFFGFWGFLVRFF
jgi:hypothetical protein